MKQSLFIEFMGDSPVVRVLDYLLTERNLDFSITDIAKNGKAKLYRLNESNPKIKKLIEIDDMLILEELKKHSKRQEIVTLPTIQIKK